jgi:hypothetical protein
MDKNIKVESNDGETAWLTIEGFSDPRSVEREDTPGLSVADFLKTFPPGQEVIGTNFQVYPGQGGSRINLDDLVITEGDVRTAIEAAVDYSSRFGAEKYEEEKHARCKSDTVSYPCEALAHKEFDSLL